MNIKFYNQLKSERFDDRSGFFPDSVKCKLKDIAFSRFRSYSRPSFLYTQDDIDTLNDLKNDKSIVIMKPDKGNGVVILNKDDYNKKIDIIRHVQISTIVRRPCESYLTT